MSKEQSNRIVTVTDQKSLTGVGNLGSTGSSQGGGNSGTGQQGGGTPQQGGGSSKQEK